MKSVVVVGSMLLLSILGFIPLTRTETSRVAVSYETQYEKTNGLELGQSKTVVEGVEGMKEETYEKGRSIIGVILGWAPKIKLVNSKMVSEPVDKVVEQGTRRWQYMICSNGGYRYFTDEQMKDKNTGFTSSSEDFCAKNNQGAKVRIADTPPGDVTQAVGQSAHSITTPPLADSSCRKENIVHYKTMYEERSYLPSGTTKVGLPGRDGYTLVCPNLTGELARTVVPVYDEVIYVGTGSSSANTPISSKDPIALQKCQSDYSRAKAQINMANAGGSSAMTQLNALHAQCVRNAGY